MYGPKSARKFIIGLTTAGVRRKRLPPKRPATSGQDEQQLRNIRTLTNKVPRLNSKGKIMFSIKNALLALPLSLIGFGATAETFDITIPQLEEHDRRYDYPLQLLELALTKAGADYTFTSKPEPTSHKRMASLMKESGEWTIGFFGFDPFNEETLRPIHFPLYRGLLGNRIAIIHKDNAVRFDEIDTLEEYMELSICQGLGWGDTPILEAAGFNVVKSGYESLFQMTQAKRCDAYTRAVFEPYAEVEGHKEQLPDLMVDDSIMIRYRLAFLMYVDPAQEELAQAIERGLAIALEDGSFQKLFESDPTVSEAKELVKENQRTCLEIPNPSISGPLNELPDEYWAGFNFGGTGGESNGCRLIGS